MPRCLKWLTFSFPRLAAVWDGDEVPGSDRSECMLHFSQDNLIHHEARMICSTSRKTCRIKQQKALDIQSTYVPCENTLQHQDKAESEYQPCDLAMLS